MIKKIAWVTMTLLGTSVALYSGLAIITPAVRPGLLQSLFETVYWSVALHLAGGMIAIIVGAFQVNGRLRARYLPAHRWLGRVYLGAVFVGSVGGFSLALGSQGGLVAHFGFGMLAVCWLFTTLNAYRYIRAGDMNTHRAWMLRSYALTLTAVTLRIYLPLFGLAGYGFNEAYPLISWISWVPNLLVVEWLILPRAQRTAAS